MAEDHTRGALPADRAFQVLLTHGAARWQLIAFGVPAVVAGVCLLGGLGPHFSLGRGKVDRRAAVAVAVALAVLVVAELAFGGTVLR